MYTIIIGLKGLKSSVSPAALIKLFQGALKQVCPITVVVFFSIAIGFVFGKIGIGAAAKDYIVTFGFSKVQMVSAVTATFVFFGMVLSGTAMVVVSGYVPPMAASMLAAIGIAGSDFIETSKLSLLWAMFHFIIVVVIFMGCCRFLAYSTST